VLERDQPKAFTSDFTEDHLNLWLTVETVKSEPVPTEQTGYIRTVVGRNFYQEVYHADKQVILELYAPWCQHCQDLEPHYEEFAQKIHDQKRALVVAKMDGSANNIPFANFDYTGFPTIFHLKPGSYEPSTVSARTADELIKYVQSKSIPKLSEVEADAKKSESLMDQFKSESVPTKTRGPVVRVVFKTFTRLVFQDHKNVVLKIYSPTCPHCKAIAPTYEEFAKKMKKERHNLVVAKIDGTANDIPFDGFECEGYPKLFFIPAGQKQPLKSFIGSYAVEQMEDFLSSPEKHVIEDE